jgi:hypothetical protein
MCNARRHSPGCTCGFGPPYLAPYGSAEVTEWSEEALENAELVTRGLEELDWDRDAIQEFLNRYIEILNSDLPRETMISRIRRLLRMRRIVEESVSSDWINVPLYRFGAPPVDGATVEYSEGASFTEGGLWILKVFGVGTGNTTSLHVSKSRTFVASAGTCKLVFIPIRLRVAKVAVYDRDKLIGRGVQAEVAPLKESGDEHMRRRGCKTVPREACAERPSQHLDILECILSGDTSGAIHRDRRSWEADTAREVSVQLSKYIDVSALVRVKRTRRLELAFTLPSGYYYRAYLGQSATWWEKPWLDRKSSSSAA